MLDLLDFKDLCVLNRKEKMVRMMEGKKENVNRVRIYKFALSRIFRIASEYATATKQVAETRDIEKMDVLGIDTEKVTEYPATMIFEAFEFGDMEYFSRIKMFDRMLDKLGLI